MIHHRAIEPLPSRPPLPDPAPTMLRISSDGTVIDFPAPILLPNARCWAATCWPDPTQPGGWGRALWWGPQPGRPGYTPVALEYSDIIEFGADLHMGTGRKARSQPVRWYGILLSRSRHELIAQGPHMTPDDAQRVALELRSCVAYRVIGEIALPEPRSTRPAHRIRLYAQTPGYEPPLYR